KVSGVSTFGVLFLPGGLALRRGRVLLRYRERIQIGVSIRNIEAMRNGLPGSFLSFIEAAKAGVRFHHPVPAIDGAGVYLDCFPGDGQLVFKLSTLIVFNPEIRDGTGIVRITLDPELI